AARFADGRNVINVDVEPHAVLPSVHSVHTRGIARETTTGRARRAGRPCVRRSCEQGRAAVAATDAHAVHGGGEGERSLANGRPVGVRPWAGGGLDEGQRAEGAPHRHSEILEPRRLPRDRGTTPSRGSRQHHQLSGGGPAVERVHRRLSRRSGASEGWQVGCERRAPGEPPHTGRCMPPVIRGNVSAPRRVSYSVSSTRMPAVAFGWMNAIRRPPTPRRGTSSTRRYPSARHRSSARSRSGTR